MVGESEEGTGSDRADFPHVWGLECGEGSLGWMDGWIGGLWIEGGGCELKMRNTAVFCGSGEHFERTTRGRVLDVYTFAPA